MSVTIAAYQDYVRVVILIAVGHWQNWRDTLAIARWSFVHCCVRVMYHICVSIMQPFSTIADSKLRIMQRQFILQHCIKEYVSSVTVTTPPKGGFTNLTFYQKPLHGSWYLGEERMHTPALYKTVYMWSRPPPSQTHSHFLALQHKHTSWKHKTAQRCFPSQKVLI